MIVESPTNPRMQICDIAAIAAIAREAGAVSCVDNSIMAPVFQRPLALGADMRCGGAGPAGDQQPKDPGADPSPPACARQPPAVHSASYIVRTHPRPSARAPAALTA